ncbi:MAG: hypothetical protein ACM3SS_05540 [Rhodospirillaceae bacterium]
MSLWVERWLPVVLAALATAAWRYVDPQPTLSEQAVNDFLSASINIGAILTGFLATSKAILMALPADSVMGRIRSSRYIDDLANYLAQAIWGCLTFAVANLVGFFAIGHFQASWEWFGTVWLALAVFSVGAFVRVTTIMLQILRHPVDRA